MGADYTMCHADAAACADSDRTFLRNLGWLSPRLIEVALGALPPGSLPEARADRQCWLLCFVMQHTADSRNLDPLAWANDERLDVYLDAVSNGKLPADLAKLGPWLKYVPANRAQKHAHRRRLLELYRRDLRRPETPRPEAVAEQADDLAHVQSHTTAREWHLLRRTAAESLEVVAESEGMPLGTLKSVLSRCRARVRKAV